MVFPHNQVVSSDTYGNQYPDKYLKRIRHAQKQENTIHNKENNQLIKTDPYGRSNKNIKTLVIIPDVQKNKFTFNKTH